MDINEIMNYNTREQRIGDRQFSTRRKKIRVAIAFIVVILVGYIFATQMQNYLKSFATTRESMVAKHQRIEGVPIWHLVITNDYND